MVTYLIYSMRHVKGITFDFAYAYCRIVGTVFAVPKGSLILNYELALKYMDILILTIHFQ